MIKAIFFIFLFIAFIAVLVAWNASDDKDYDDTFKNYGD